MNDKLVVFEIYFIFLEIKFLFQLLLIQLYQKYFDHIKEKLV